MPKLTFSLDEEAVRLLRRSAARARKPQSQIVREAIAQYAAREETLSEAERDRLLEVLRTIKARPATRPQSEVGRELQEIRHTRRTGWSRRMR
jgi:predicted transcriptional regulator